MKVLRLRISGRVQGVGFRAFLADEAEARGLAGWSRNRADGTVEALVAGDDKLVGDMVAACRKGPRGARVEAIALEEASEPDIAGRSGFEILRTL